MNSPLVSIVIPLYNKEKYIQECLTSIVNQEYSNWECVVVDDGSSDQSIHIAERFIREQPGNWKLIRKTNGGPSSARNLGIRNSSGEYIAFLDADDLWLPNKISTQLEFLKKSPKAWMALSDYVILEKDYKSIRVVRSSRSSKLLDKWLDMRGFGGLVESTGLVRHEIFRNNIFFDENLGTGEGLDFMLQVASKGVFVVIPEALTIYRLSEGQLHTNENAIRINMKKITKKYAHTPREFDNVDKWQEAYFELSSLRNLRKVKIASSLAGKFARLDFTLIHMAYSISFRNLRAKFVPSTIKAQVKLALEQISK